MPSNPASRPTPKSARGRFEIGDHVVMTPIGRDQFIGARRNWRGKETTRGVVVGFCIKPELVKVLRERRSHPERFHVDFWRTENVHV